MDASLEADATGFSTMIGRAETALPWRNPASNEDTPTSTKPVKSRSRPRSRTTKSRILETVLPIEDIGRLTLFPVCPIIAHIGFIINSPLWHIVRRAVLPHSVANRRPNASASSSLAVRPQRSAISWSGSVVPSSIPERMWSARATTP